MEIILQKRPKNVTIIQGFPGIGMVGAIAAEFLIQHLDSELIGKIILDKTPPLVAVHQGKLIEPFSIYYNRKYNLMIIHSIIATPGAEWQLAEAVVGLANDLKAKEIISLEGIGSATETETSKTLYYSRSRRLQNLLKKAKIEQLSEGIIIGQTSALLVKADVTPVSCIFAETHTNLPDSKAAAELIKALDAVLGLKIDYKPLLQVAAQFEEKFRGIMVQSEKARDLQEKKQMSYVG
ncbi:proteasome assembly chaperone family protein [Candidatus Woesearchaeota archaeon]|nr:proteasome assembly chaperone family protein [Candidatus Woesearchaeota archaeon]